MARVVIFVTVVAGLTAVAGLGVVVYGVNPVFNDSPFAVIVEPEEITFHIDGPPGLYEAGSPVNVSVRSGFPDWSLHCQATPLTEISKGWVIPARRLFIIGAFQDAPLGSEGLLSLDQPILVGRGSFTGPEFTLTSVLQFRLRTDWTDHPGTYKGKVTFTFLATP